MSKLLCFLGIHSWEYFKKIKYSHNKPYQEQSRICKVCNKKQLKYCGFDFSFWY